MPFLASDLLLSEARAAQLTRALANLGVADPLQYLCDEAAADVSRLTTGYSVDEASARGFIRALALQRIYAKAGPVPPDVEKDHAAAMRELEAIAKGERPNLAQVTGDGQVIPGGRWGSEARVEGRTSA